MATTNPVRIDSSRFEQGARKCADLYRPDGRLAHGYVRGKLLGDPVYRQLIERGPFAEPIIDLGCGRGQTGLLISVLFSEVSVHGFDWHAEKLERARRAASRADSSQGLTFSTGDLRNLDYPPAKTLLMLDVLHYNPLEIQDQMLDRAASCLLPGGRLFIREVDARAGWRARTNMLQERLGCLLGINRGATLRFRSADSIEAILRSHGLDTRRCSSWEGTPLANVLIEASRAPKSTGSTDLTCSERPSAPGAGHSPNRD